jgi:hypothetical protein
MRRIPLLLLAAGVAVALVPSAALATSFPTKSYLHTMRHAVRNGRFQAISEDNAQREIDRREKQAQKLDHQGFTDEAQAVRDGEAVWRGELHYLKALDDRISALDPQHFDYRGLLRWMDHNRHRLFADIARYAKGLHPGDGVKLNYSNGGETALGSNRPKIVAIGRARGAKIT